MGRNYIFVSYHTQKMDESMKIKCIMLSGYC